MIIQNTCLLILKNQEDIKEYTDILKLKALNLEQICLNLSGGNQQKLLLQSGLLKNKRY